MKKIGERYILDDEPIGRGGMGEVYRGHDERLGGRAVAVKKLAREYWGEERTLERLKREVELPAKIKDKRYIVEVYDVVEEDSYLYVVMEFVEGGKSLEDAVTDDGAGGKGAPTVEEARRFFEQACLGLGAIHDSGIVHGDVKARNFLQTDQGDLKIGDFGVSRLSANPELTTRPWGTARTMAPEVYDGRMSEGSDIYGLGFTIYELFVGKKAFEQAFQGQTGATNPPVAWMRWHTDIDTPPPAARDVWQNVPEEISLILSKMMAKKEEERPTVDEVLSVVASKPSLENGVAGDVTRPVDFKRESSDGAQSGARKMNRIVAFGLVAVLIVVLGLALMLMRQKNEIGSIRADLKSLTTNVDKLNTATEKLGAQDQAIKTLQSDISKFQSWKSQLGENVGKNPEIVRLGKELGSLKQGLAELKNLPQFQSMSTVGKGEFQTQVDRIEKNVERLAAVEEFVKLLKEERDAADEAARLGREHLKIEGFDFIGKNTKGYPEYEHGKTGLVFVLLEGGDFDMGSREERGTEDNEGPVVSISLPSFMVCKTEATQRAWKKIMGTSPWAKEENVISGDDFPVVCVTVDDVSDFCDRTGLRLPSEAEWEFACRAGTVSLFSFGDNEKDIGLYAWYSANTVYDNQKYPHRVGTQLPNPFGLHDMHGNVWELCADKWCDSHERADPTGRPRVDEGINHWVIRGGGLNNDAANCRSACRAEIYLNHQRLDSGFRPVFRLPDNR